ncbi:MAG TPA: CpXC domain-containing protein [Anaerolineales bacterium]|nr:CpXC domain-containing protein [Anaerolineales bacterium]HMV95458.1 CpXC domain-containing protein [Anaerolineales bacterium]HMX73094.1 CpXC domain-containing protein [Anaerolineales bacterium]HMZ42032.1 CpXC domain-containing protein [Anaerolineales bacterium]HNA52880.1 CpXC domain-containing protein [Anaerolineales bacterium]
MPQTTIACPRCKQMIPANVEQLFDVTHEPAAKQRLLSGQSNHARCQYCGYEGRLATPVVYHDNDKELLLTFFPFELGLPVNEQEKLIGPLIKQVTERLPLEKRKAYLLKPQANLTYESMIETILNKDGISSEMIKTQQERVMLIEKLIRMTSADARLEMIRQNENAIDEQFFSLFSRIAQNAMQSGQETIARALIDLQRQLLDETAFGRQLRDSVAELEAAQKTLQDAGQGLTREKLLDFVLESQNDSRIRAYVSLARGGMDYVFFQLLTEKIEKAAGEEKSRMEGIRDKVLGFVSDVDKQMEARYKQAQDFVENLLAQEDIERATQENLENFTQDAVEVVNQLLRQASEKNDYARMGKLQKMVQVLQAASTPPEVAFIEHLLQAPDEATLDAMLSQNEEMVNQQFIDALSGLVAQMDSQGADNPEAKAMGEKLTEIYRVALKRVMKKNMG